jgi:hypothetical protein
MPDIVRHGVCHEIREPLSDYPLGGSIRLGFLFDRAQPCLKIKTRKATFQYDFAQRPLPFIRLATQTRHLGITLGQVFSDLTHEVDSAMAGNQALDMLVVGVVQCARDLARGQWRILE